MCARGGGWIGGGSEWRERVVHGSGVAVSSRGGWWIVAVRAVGRFGRLLIVVVVVVVVVFGDENKKKGTRRRQIER